MGTVKDKFDEVYRDFVTPGVASSGRHEPTKPEIRIIGALIEELLVGAAFGTIYETTAAGIAATTTGKLFLVKGTGNSFANLYKNNAGVAVTQGVALPNTAYVSSVEGRLNVEALLKTARSDGSPAPGYDVDTNQSQVKNLRPGLDPYDAVRMDQLNPINSRIDAVMLQAIGLNYQVAVQYSATADYLQPGATSQSWSYNSPAGGFGAIGISIPPQAAGAVIRASIEQRTRVGAPPTVALWNQALNGGKGARLVGTAQALRPVADGLVEYVFTVPAGATATAIEFETNSIAPSPNSGEIYCKAVKGPQRSLEAVVADLQKALGALSLTSETWTDADKAILWPTPVAFVAGHKNTLYGRQIVRKRARQSKLDVHFVCSGENDRYAGLSAYMTPQFSFQTEELVNGAGRIEVKDPDYVDTIWSKDFGVRIASATQTGEILLCLLGDSTAALSWTPLKAMLLASGATVRVVGTLALESTNFYEGRPGWSAMDYMGRTRPTSFANPFLRPLSVSVPAELAIIQANPTKCFADDSSYGTGTRPSYAQDATKASYSLFSWAYWRANGAVALTGAEKLRVVLQLGRNGTTSPTWIADNDLAQNHIVEDFLAVFPSGTMIVSSETLGDGTDTNNGVQQATGYSEFTAPLIAKKIAWFSNREARRVWLAPAWAMMDGYGAFDLNAPSATDADTGTQRRTIKDVVHYTSQLRSQHAAAIRAPLLFSQQTSIYPFTVSLPSGVTYSRTGVATALTAGGTVTSFAANAARVTDRGLLIETAATNLVLRSLDYANSTASGYNMTASSVGSLVAGPDGTNSASPITESSASAGLREVTAINVVNGSAYAVSYIVKRTNSDWVRLIVASSTALTNGVQAWFNIATGVIGTFSVRGTGWTQETPKILALGGGYYRITIIATASGTALFSMMATANGDNGGTRNDIGGGIGIGSGYILHNHDVTLTAVSSPIVTTGAAATRGIDVATLTAPAANWSAVYGTANTVVSGVVASGSSFDLVTSRPWIGLGQELKSLIFSP